MRGKSSVWLSVLAGLAVSFGCAPDEYGAFQARQVLSTATQSLSYEVDYMEGAEPDVSLTEDGDPVWFLLKNNVEALFGRRIKVHVPVSLKEMEQIPAEKKDYTTDDLMRIAKQYRDAPPYTAGQATLYVLYVDGSFLVDGKPDASVLGVSLGGTGVIAMFHPRVTLTTPTTTTLRDLNLSTFVEQSTLIHESGHALGLVDNGIPALTEHRDHEHGAHCSNPNCIMYYINEGWKDLREFLDRTNPSVNTVFFGEECLQDAQAAPLAAPAPALP